MRLPFSLKRSSFGLYKKIMLTMFVVAVIPLLVVTSFSYSAGTKALQQSTGISFQHLSEEAATKAEILIRSEIDEAKLLSKDHSIINGIIAANGPYGAMSESERKRKIKEQSDLWQKNLAYRTKILNSPASLSLKEFVEDEAEYHVYLIITDKYGRLAASQNDKVDFDQSQSSWFKNIVSKQKIYVGEPYLDKKSQQYVFDLVAPILSDDGKQTIGYLLMVHEIKGFFSDVTSVRVGVTGHAMLADASGTILVCPILPPLSHKIDPALRTIITSQSAGWTITDKSPHSMNIPNAIAGYAPIFYGKHLDLDSSGRYYIFLSQDPDETYSSPSGAFAPLYSVLTKVFVLGFGLMTLILFLGFFVTRKIIDPINTLHDGAEILGNGNLDFRFNIKTGDEIEDLSIEFNKMAENLKQSLERLKKWNVELENEVSSRTEDLRVAISQLETANKLKSEFLANVSHELRTPLNSIIGFAELLKDQSFGELNDKQLRYSDNIYRSGRQLLQLISELLDLSKIEAGQMELNITNFDPGIELEFIESSIKPLAQMKNINLTFNLMKPLPAITADENKFRQIMNNLLSNAIKFTEKDGKVEVIAKAEGDDLLFSVKDNGIGISVANQAKVFEEFKQVDNSYSREFGGTGLGLTLSKNFVEMHGGRIWLESELEKGSTFYFTLPRIAILKEGKKLIKLPSNVITVPSPKKSIEIHPSATSPIPPEKQEPIEIIQSDGTGKMAEAAAAADAATEIPSHIKPATTDSDDDLIRKLSASKYSKKTVSVKHQKALILVVEDDVRTNQLISTYISEAGYAVATAYDGDEAIKKATQLKPFAITLDIMLPKKSGWQVLKKLKESDATKDTPIIILSVLDDRRTAYQMGIIDYLIKPVDSKELVRKLDGLRFLTQLKKAVGLIVSDNRTELESLVPAIEQNSKYAIITADNETDALDLALNYRPSFMILDLSSSKLNVLDLSKKLKEIPATRGIPVILMSNSDLDLEEVGPLKKMFIRIINTGRKFKDELLTEISTLEKLYPDQAGYVDPLSGLYNKDYLIKRLGEELLALAPGKLGFTVCVTELKYPSNAPNPTEEDRKCLQDEAGKILTSNFRDIEAMILSDIGSFAVLIRSVSKSETDKIIQRLDNELRRSDILCGKKVQTVIGFTYFGPENSSISIITPSDILSLLVEHVRRTVPVEGQPTIPTEITILD